jgi:predicted ATPase
MARLPLFSNVAQIGRVHLNFLRIVEATDIFRKNESLRKQMVSLLQDWDFGLSDIVLKETEFREMDSTEVAKHYMPFGVHTDGEREAERMFVAESSGTQGAYVLLSHILPALAKGGVAVIDELEADLHPRMLAPIMDLFLSQQTNPKDAQIIFTCHAAEILNLLQKPQIMLVEKDEHSYSEAWRLDSVKGVRKDDNLYAKYMAGAYGAVPQV